MSDGVGPDEVSRSPTPAWALKLFVPPPNPGADPDLAAARDEMHIGA